MESKKRLFLHLGTLLFFGIASATALLEASIQVFRETRAIPAEEFPPAAFLFSWEAKCLLIQKIAFFLFLLFFTLKFFCSFSQKKSGSFWSDIFTLLGFVGAFYSIYGWCLAFFGLYFSLLFEIITSLEKNPSWKTNPFWREPFSFKKEGAFFLELFWLFLSAILLCLFIELGAYTFSFTEKVFRGKDFLQFSLLAIATSVGVTFCFCFEMFSSFFLIKQLFQKKSSPFVSTLFFLGGSALFFLILKSFAWQGFEVGIGIFSLYFLRWVWRDGHFLIQQLIACTFIPYLYFWMRTQDILLQVLGDEIHALGLYPVIVVFFGLLGLFLLFGMTMGLFFFFRYFSLNSLQDIFCVAIFSSVFPFFLGPLKKSLSRSLKKNMCIYSCGACVVLSFFLFFLVKLNYPGFADHSELLEGLYSLLLIFLSFLWVFLFYTGVLRYQVECRIKSIWAIFFLGISASILFFSLSSKQTLRMIGSQYSKIGKRSLQQFSFLYSGQKEIFSVEDSPKKNENLFQTMDRLPSVPQVSFYEKRRPPIFFIIWDAARSDHMSAYGYSRKTTPTVEDLVKESIVFENTYANATATTASIRHLFTGKYSSRFMLDKNHAPFFTGALAEIGYDRFLLNIFGSDFNGVSEAAFFRNQKNSQKLSEITTTFGHYEASYKTKKAIDLLQQVLDERIDRTFPGDGIFIMLHYSETHYPWQNWEDHPIYGESLQDRYDNSMGHQDTALAEFLNALKELKLYEDAILILTADHGTGLGEHGRYGGFQPYQEQIRVPFICKFPKFSPSRIRVPVAGIDLAPTLMSLFRPGQKNPYDGFSLLELMGGTKETLSRRYLVSFNSFRDSLALLDLQTQYKIHFHRTDPYAMLYDLGSDPQEKINLADQEPERTRVYLQFLREFLWNGRKTFGNPFHYRDWNSE